MLDVLQAVAFSLVFSTGVMRLVDWIDRPGKRKAAHGVEPVRGAKRNASVGNLKYTTRSR